MTPVSFTPIAALYCDFPEKFGLPRQSGLIPEIKSKIIFEPEFRDPNAIRGLSGFSHIWLLWQFTGNGKRRWSPTVRPPRLGGNERMGVFATRSPNRPNPLGLSAVKIESIELSTPQGPVITVSGGDLASGTPIFDIKPYIPYADRLDDAIGGFADTAPDEKLIISEEEKLSPVPKEKRSALIAALKADPRPAYQNDPSRIYKLSFAGFDISFSVEGAILKIENVQKQID